MEQMNRVELRGLVGSTKVQTHSGRRVCRMSVATSRAYKDAMGVAKIDTTWHTVNAWEGNGIPNLDLIVKGSKVKVNGSIRNFKFTTEDGVDHYSSEIQAKKIQLLEDDEPLAYEM